MSIFSFTRGRNVLLLALLAAVAAFAFERSHARPEPAPGLARAPIVSPGDSTPTPDAPPAPALVAATARATNAEFALGLFRRAAAAARDTNLFVSPTGAEMALSLVADGGGGHTRDEMLRALGSRPGDADSLDAANAALRRALDVHAVDLRISNELRLADASIVAPGFVQRARQDYGASVGRLDAGEGNDGVPTAVRVIGRVSFVGRWADEFDASATRPRDFHLASGQTVRRPMMSRQGGYALYAGGGVRVLRLPYRGRRFAMYVVLPDSGRTLASVVQTLTPRRWSVWMDSVHDATVDVALPRFTLRHELDLEPPLRGLGMRRAFEPAEAEFAPMFAPGALAGRRAWITRADQDVYVKVDEQGTRAVAVTDVSVGDDTAARVEHVESFVADRPFLAVIRDDATGALLFVGQVYDPIEEQIPPQ